MPAPPQTLEPVPAPPQTLEPVPTPPQTLEPVPTPPQTLEPVPTPPQTLEPVSAPPQDWHLLTREELGEALRKEEKEERMSKETECCFDPSFYTSTQPHIDKNIRTPKKRRLEN